MKAQQLNRANQQANCHCNKSSKALCVQTPDADHDRDRVTSEAVMVFHKNEGVQKSLSVGNLVRVKGTVSEYVPVACILVHVVDFCTPDGMVQGTALYRT